jgi:hypothetical protein
MMFRAKSTFSVGVSECSENPVTLSSGEGFKEKGPSDNYERR